MADDKERLMKCRMKDLKEVNERSIKITRKEGQEIIIVNKRQIRRLIKQWTADSYQQIYLPILLHHNLIINFILHNFRIM